MRVLEGVEGARGQGVVDGGRVVDWFHTWRRLAHADELVG